MLAAQPKSKSRYPFKCFVSCENLFPGNPLQVCVPKETVPLFPECLAFFSLHATGEMPLMLQIQILGSARLTSANFFLLLFQSDDDRPHSGPRSNQLRRLASYVFSSSTLETEQYPHAGGSFIQRSRSAESSPAHGNMRSGSRRHPPLQAPGSPRSRHSMLNVSRLQLQQMLAKLMNKNS